MQIGEPIRIIIVEPLELPIKEAQKWPEPAAFGTGMGSGCDHLMVSLGDPGTPLQARCRVCDFALWSRGHQAGLSSHIAPDLKCTCGIYAGGNLEHMRKPSYERSLIYGQVLLWGTVVEHQRGWRAQYAYPHSFLLPPEVLPVTLMELRAGSRL
jgi:hypothetical protein